MDKNKGLPSPVVSYTFPYERVAFESLRTQGASVEMISTVGLGKGKVGEKIGSKHVLDTLWCRESNNYREIDCRATLKRAAGRQKAFVRAKKGLRGGRGWEGGRGKGIDSAKSCIRYPLVHETRSPLARNPPKRCSDGAPKAPKAGSVSLVYS